MCLLIDDLKRYRPLTFTESGVVASPQAKEARLGNTTFANLYSSSSARTGARRAYVDISELSNEQLECMLDAIDPGDDDEDDSQDWGDWDSDDAIEEPEEDFDADHEAPRQVFEKGATREELHWDRDARRGRGMKRQRPVTAHERKAVARHHKVPGTRATNVAGQPRREHIRYH